jgi:hypothetical protein
MWETSMNILFVASVAITPQPAESRDLVCAMAA